MSNDKRRKQNPATERITLRITPEERALLRLLQGEGGGAPRSLAAVLRALLLKVVLERGPLFQERWLVTLQRGEEPSAGTTDSVRSAGG